MMKSIYKIFLLLILFRAFPALAQEEIEPVTDLAEIDSLYREDQFYLGFTYNILTDVPDEITVSGFSGGIHTGFIRDFPINERRNVAIGLGLGWSINTFSQNLFIGEEANTEKTIFQVIDETEIDFDKNRFTTQSIDIPLQFRWRTSTLESYKFWRIYSGLRLGYVYYFRSTFEQPGYRARQTDVPEFNPFRLGATFTFGYNTFNFHFYYSLNSFFGKEAQVNGQEIRMKTFQIGLMFYIL